jgi:hypothetical protein
MHQPAVHHHGGCGFDTCTLDLVGVLDLDDLDVDAISVRGPLMMPMVLRHLLQPDPRTLISTRMTST